MSARLKLKNIRNLLKGALKLASQAETDLLMLKRKIFNNTIVITSQADLVDLGDVCCMVKAKEGFDLEYWKNFECMHFVKINYCPMCGRKLTEADDGND